MTGPEESLPSLLLTLFFTLQGKTILCWSFDLLDRMKTRPEIEPFLWDPENLTWPVPAGKKPDLIFFDPPYFKKMADHYMKGSISDFSRPQYLKFFKDLFSLMREHS
ncbi:MAG: hypothetical protein JRC91_14500, partial [Deltaproteobacteria bacterium]|nr:hypothetical protein [Deltaproteobacteria bacterium]